MTESYRMVSVTGFTYDFVDGTYFVCTNCSYAWRARNDKVIPRSCPKCGSRTWKNCCHHECCKCGYKWTNSRNTVVKCPHCQSRKWDEANRDHDTRLSEQEITIVLELFNRGHGAVRISRETGIPFGHVYDFLMREVPEEKLAI